MLEDRVWMAAECGHRRVESAWCGKWTAGKV